jgi:integrase
MAVQRLTAAFVQEARAKPGKEREVFWDESFPSFGLMVTSAGHRSWVVQYRAGRVSRRLTIPAVLSLADARKQARAVLGEVARGGDPVQERRRTGSTLQTVCESYVAREGAKLRSTPWRHGVLKRLVYPALGTREIGDIKRSDINKFLDDVEDKSGRAMADGVLAIMRRVSNWHAARDDTYASPFVRGMSRRHPDERERSRILKDEEIRALWKTTETFPSPWGQFVRFLMLTASRRTEAAGMTWQEVKGDLWVIPAIRYKTNTETSLPLSGAALRVLEGIPSIEGCDYVFSTNGRAPIGGFSGFKLRLDAACRVSGWRLHDLRRTSRSLMSRAGVSADTGERCLGHSIKGVRGVYDRHAYTNEMREAFERLAALIDHIVQ